MAKKPSRGPKGRRPGGPSSNLRKNDRIRVREVRVIGPEGKQIGVMQTKDARDLAKKYGLDLVEVSPTARPPVCRILDFGKFMYEQSKRTKDSKSTTVKLKEVKFRIRIDQHDYMTKVKRAESFLYKGNKLKITLMFRGREMEHAQLGFKTVNRALEDLEHVCTRDAEPRLHGRNITVTASPLPANKRKLKYGAPDEEIDDEESEEEVEDVEEAEDAEAAEAAPDESDD